MSQTISAARITVLVVDDDVLVRMDAAGIFEDAGFIVIEAANADQAILMLEKYPEISVLFTDIEMPGTMDGLKLAYAVRHRWPPVVLIIASGRIRPLISEMPHDTLFLAKPYSPDAVVSAVKRAA